MSSSARYTPRRFAPLKPSNDEAANESPRLQGIVFDVDGTLCEPQTYMFAEMRAALNIPKSQDILNHIYTLPTESEREEGMEKVRQIERNAMASQTPQPGLLPLMTYLSTHHIQKAICTRNFDAPVTHLLTKFLPGEVFDPIITREFRPPKPDPAGILHIAREWGVGVEDPEGTRKELPLLMVGDSLDDMTAGYRAGAATVLLVNDVNAHLATHEHTDLCIYRLDELVDVLERGFVGRVESGVEESQDSTTGERAEEVLHDRRGEV